MSGRGHLLLNAGLFQLGWFACVFGAQRPWLLLIAIACLAIHLIWIANDLNEWRSLLRVAACGWVLDSALLHLGLFYFSDVTLVLPLWLAILWLLFASTFRHSLSWTKRPWWMGSLLGTFAGPLSYWGGARLADVGLPLGVWPSVLLLALIWAILMPALHWMAGHHAR
ncbi:DUF2878 domain-containing protein [Pseudomonas sp. ANT_J28]|uniref:DUF2878 domain-containing protein n=1 Tax=Pseudomonas sp. ANT_J28 TaxID=2597352 RepID=UPI0011F279FB|nr:DUF2878 domain-containing protein [Pseudomonas sp. ANT_J28]KAA0977043.1 DUF2878 domain-containing protein [Pseudomonas sp. ANT_J28]